MALLLHTRLRELREQHRFTREELAKRVGITRQAIALIEGERMSPGTQVALRLAKALGSTVEDLFWDEDEAVFPAVYMANYAATRGSRPTRVYISEIAGKSIARPVDLTMSGQGNPPAHAVIAHTVGGNLPESSVIPTSSMDWLQPRTALPDTVYITGCDVGLPLLSSYITQQSMARQAVWYNRSNHKSVKDFQEGLTHVAAVHFPATFDWSTLGLTVPIRLFHFAEAELGWILPQGNPLHFSEPGDLSSGRMRLVNRPAGAGARAILDRELQNAAVLPEQIPGYAFEVAGHLEVADAVAKGYADIGVGHAGAAACFGLDFLPLQKERCSLLVREDCLEQESVKALLDTLQSDRFRKELAAFGPYNVQYTGKEL